MISFRSLRTKVTLSAVAILIASFAVTYVVSYRRIKTTFEQELHRDESTLLADLSQRVSSVIGDIKWLSVEIVLSENLQRLLRKHVPAGSFESMLDSMHIGDQLQSFRFSRDRNIDLAIIKTNGDVACYPGTTKEIMWKDWYHKAMHPVRKTKGIFTGVLPNPFKAITGGDELIICYIKTITEVYGPKADLGTLVINIDYRHIEELFALVPKDQASYVLRNANGGLIYASRPQPDVPSDPVSKAIGEINGISIYSEGESLVFRDETMEDGWVLEKTVPKAYLSRMIRHGLQSIIVIGILSVVIATATIVALMLSLTRSVFHLQNAMKSVSRGDFATVVHLKSHDEMEELADIFNRMVQDVRGLLVRVAQQEQQKKESELKTLLMQINPHFLSNALHSIVSLARSRKCEDIVVVVNSLVRMLHSIMNFEQHFISVSAEIAYLDNYLEMQKIRYGELFEISYNIDDSAVICQIPKLLLQPIVENAIYHGILPSERPGTITMVVKRRGEHLYFAIHDNGIGIEEARLKELFVGQSSAGNDSFMKIGLRNVDERVRLCNDGDGGLTVQSNPAEGTTISFRLPILIP